MMWKDFFYFSRYEKQGIIVLIIILLLTIVTNLYFSFYSFPVETYDYEQSKVEYNTFINSIKENEPPKKRESNSTYTKKGKNNYLSRDYNNSILVDSNLDQKIKKDSEKYAENNTNKYPRQFKYPKGTLICLNNADTTELMKIPGIGIARAGMIINYRKKLGGFVSIHQLSELEKLNSVVDTLYDWFCIEDSTTQRINLNTAGIEILRTHPYINFYQAKVIVEHRKKKGKLKNVEELMLYEEFNKNEIKRILPYISL